MDSASWDPPGICRRGIHFERGSPWVAPHPTPKQCRFQVPPFTANNWKSISGGRYLSLQQQQQQRGGGSGGWAEEGSSAEDEEGPAPRVGSGRHFWATFYRLRSICSRLERRIQQHHQLSSAATAG